MTERSPDVEGRLRATHEVGGYREYAPPVELGALVGRLWTHRAPAGERAAGESAPHRVLPEPDVSLAYVVEGGTRHTAGSRRLFLVGPVRKHRFYAPAPGVRMYAIRLKAEWCRPLLGTHPTDHADALDDLEDIRPDLARPLLGALEESAIVSETLRRMVDAVRGWASKADLSPAGHPAHRGLERLRETAPTVRLGAACREWAVSSRHLRRVVRDATGLSPKEWLRAKRLSAALFEADRTASPAWSRVALDWGYYDQSHLIRDAQALAGASPGALHGERRVEPVPVERCPKSPIRQSGDGRSSP